jgi:cyclophilin family peptidyl-prolyl cis-trans isomerase/HEAT repeat protein
MNQSLPFTLLCLLPICSSAQRSALSGDDVARWAALLRIEDARVADSAVVMRALDADAPAVRTAAIRTIGRNRIASLYPLLRDRLRASTRDTLVAAEAAFALGLARDTLACPELRRSLERDHSVGVAAAWALGEIGAACREVGDAIAAVARGTVVLPVPTTAALLQASVPAKLADRSSLVTIAGASKTAAPVRWSAFWALARLRETSATRLALHWAAGRDPRIAEQALRLLASGLVTERTLRDSARRVAVAQLRSVQPHLRIAAVRVAASYDTTGSGSELLALLQRDPDANVRQAISEGLAQRLAAGHVGWMALWNRDTVWARRSAVLAEALRRDTVTAQSVMLPGVEHDVRVRMLLLDRARATLDAGFTARALAAARDTAWQLRARAISVIGSVGRDSLDAVLRATLGPALQDADDAVREAAADALGTHGGRADVAPLIDGFRRETSNPAGVDVQLGILRSLGGIRGRDSAAVPDSLLSMLELPIDLRTREAVAGLPSLVAVAQSIRAPRFADSSYARIVREIAWPSVLGFAPRMTWETVRGPIVAELHGDVAPLTVWNIMALARDGFYRATRFHRVVPGFVAQDGDPRGSGGGGPGYAIPDELNRLWYLRGAVGMALSGPDTGGSQYFFTLSPQPHLDGRYTVFATVVAGWSAMDALVQGDALLALQQVPRTGAKRAGRASR